MKGKILPETGDGTYRMLTGTAEGDGCGVKGAGWPGNDMINWDRVAELRGEVGEDGFAEVVVLFLEETDDVVARLEAGVPAGSLGQALHFLKGSALNLGFQELAAHCQEGERQAGCGNGAPVDQRRIAGIYRDSKAAFLAGLARSFAA